MDSQLARRGASPRVFLRNSKKQEAAKETSLKSLWSSFRAWLDDRKDSALSFYLFLSVLSIRKMVESTFYEGFEASINLGRFGTSRFVKPILEIFKNPLGIFRHLKELSISLAIYSLLLSLDCTFRTNLEVPAEFLLFVHSNW